MSVEVSTPSGESPSFSLGGVVIVRRASETIWAATVGGGGRAGALLMNVYLSVLLPTELAVWSGVCEKRRGMVPEVRHACMNHYKC